MSTVKEPSYRKRIGYQAALLGGFATMAALLLVTGHGLTKAAIEARRQEDLLSSLNQVIPAHLHDQDLLGNNLWFELGKAAPLRIYRAVRNGQVSALAYEMTGTGYAGDIRVLLGLDITGKLLGVRVLAHAETPGLGDKIEPQRDPWILGFTGLSLGNPPAERWRVKKDGGDFDQFSGATITPRAVVGAVREGLTLFQTYQGELIALQTRLAPANEEKQP